MEVTMDISEKLSALQVMQDAPVIPVIVLTDVAQAVLLARALGEVLSEPKPSVQFDGEGLPEAGWASHEAIALDRRTRMLHDGQHVFVNGEAFVVGGKDGRLLRQLADVRALTAREAAGLSEGARAVMEDWIDMGWLHVQHE